MEERMTPMTDDAQVTDAETETAPTVEAMAAEATESVPPEASSADPVAVQAVADRELKAIVESLLFVSPDPLSVQRLVAVIGDVKKADIDRALRSLAEDLEQEGRGVRLAEIAGGYRLVTKQEYSAWIKRLDKTKSTAKLSRSALESLAIIAYKQPIVKSEIEEIRGVETSGVVRTLLERKLVRIVGRKEVPGRPIMYGTTKYFLEHFGLNDLSQLPPLREFKELGESDQSMLPMGDVEIQAPEVSAEAAEAAEGTEAELSLTDSIEAAVPEGESDDAVPVSEDEALLGETVEQA
jgi:segregation and condensation protein B